MVRVVVNGGFKLYLMGLQPQLPIYKVISKAMHRGSIALCIISSSGSILKSLPPFVKDRGEPFG